MSSTNVTMWSFYVVFFFVYCFLFFIMSEAYATNKNIYFDKSHNFPPLFLPTPNPSQISYNDLEEFRFIMGYAGAE